ncbi:MAG: PAS domain S-box protein, partial [Bacteroidetes bacterium]|nr:PAS domain S-box protein [Bacteroidota bacterium]
FSPAGIMLEDTKGNILEVNEAMSAILGYSQSELSKMTVFDLVPQKVLNEVNINISDIVNGKNLKHEVVNIRKDGSLCYLELIETKITLDDSGAEAILAVCNDISARKEAETALQENEENLRTLINSTPDMIVFKDSRGRWIEANRAALEMFELTNKEYKGKNDAQLCDLVPFFRTPLTLCSETDEKAFEKQANFRVEEHIPTRGGTTKIFDVIKVPLFYPNGKRKGLIVYGRDITNFNAVLSELIKSKDEAEAATRIKSQFLATISHEIRTPLNGVIGMTSILLDSDLDREYKDSIEIIKQSGESLLALINEILDFSKIESGKIALDKKPFEIRVSVNDVLDIFRAYCGRKGIRIDSNVAKDVPEYVEGDSNRFRQILTNLVGNSVKFTDSGEILITVRKEKQQKKKITLLCSVSDTGEGIPPDYLADIFSPFTQAETSRRKRTGGTGLGLSISKKLVELMKGKIWCKSEPGSGTTFFFTIEFDSADVPEKNKEEADKKFDYEDVARQYPHEILLVEDNPINQKVAQRILKKFGYDIAVSNNGVEALNILREKTFDIIFMDVQMPEMDGLEATRRIKEIYGEESPHIIAMTAAVMKGDKERCIEAGMIDYIPKPVVPEVVLTALKKYSRPV